MGLARPSLRESVPHVSAVGRLLSGVSRAYGATCVGRRAKCKGALVWPETRAIASGAHSATSIIEAHRRPGVRASSYDPRSSPAIAVDGTKLPAIATAAIRALDTSTGT